LDLPFVDVDVDLDVDGDVDFDATVDATMRGLAPIHRRVEFPASRRLPARHPVVLRLRKLIADGHYEDGLRLREAIVAMLTKTA
jgi:hypothetical protein